MTAATAPATLDLTNTPPTPFTRVVAVELRKIVDTRAGKWLIGAIVAITAIVMAIFFFAAPEDERTFNNFMGIAATPQGFLLPVLGILLITSEWSQRTAMVTFALEPSRSRVVAAKTASAMLLGIGAFVAAVVIGALATLIAGEPGAWDGAGGEMLMLFFLLQLITVMQGLAYGMLLLNTPAAIVTFFVLPIASSIVFSLVSALEDAAPWIDLGTAQTPLFEGAADLTGEMYAQLGVTSLIWIVLPFVAGWFRILRAELK